MRALLTIALIGLCGCAHPMRQTHIEIRERFFRDRPDQMYKEVVTSENYKAGGTFVFTYAGATNLVDVHANSKLFGGSSIFSSGGIGTDISTNAAAVIKATGDAVGEGIGAAVKAAVK
jgi:hypothetical protein